MDRLHCPKTVSDTSINLSSSPYTCAFHRTDSKDPNIYVQDG